MRIARIDAVHPDPSEIAEAGRLIGEGRVVVFPTETVYGIGANALDPVAVRAIFSIKGRPSSNPLIVHVPDVDAAKEIVREWPRAAEALAAAFWPGPLTLVLPKRSMIGPEVTAGLATVGVRVPDHPVALALLRAANVPIAAPSANPFMRLSPTEAIHVARSFDDGVDLLLDAGPAPVGIESTVLDLSGAVPVLLRPGSIARESLEEVLGRAVRTAPALAPGAARPAPGMMGRHYAPRARLILVDPESADPFAMLASTRPERAAVVLLSLEPPPGTGETIRMPTDPNAYARRLYATLHALDDRGVETIFVEQVPAGDEWDGIRDRLRRASTASEEWTEG